MKYNITKLAETPRVYVGTYAKYNNGSITGKWLDLEDYSDLGEFYEACKELHKDEIDPEFMFQDHENIHEKFIGESFINKEIYEYLEACNNTSQEIVHALLDNGLDYNHEDVSMIEKHDSLSFEENIGYYHAENDFIPGFNEATKTMQDYFDYKSYGHDESINGTYIDLGDTILMIHN